MSDLEEDLSTLFSDSEDQKPDIASPPVGTVGHLEVFDTAKPETFESYVDRFELYCLSNKIEDSRKLATLMTLGGSYLYATASAVLMPVKVVGADYKTLLEKLTAHFVPPRSVWARRVDFSGGCRARMRLPTVLWLLCRRWPMTASSPHC